MGISREKFISSPDSERSTLFAHIFDMASSCFNHSKICYGMFLSESEQSDLIKKASHLPCPYTLFGGYDDAERKMVAFLPDYAEPDFPISVLNIKTPNLGKLTHRDFLGSLLGLGIKREKCGDIIISEDLCSVILHSDIARFACDNLIRVGREGVSTSIDSIDSLVLPEKEFSYITGTVSSPRLDAIVALFIKSGRNQAAEFISSGRVFVNGICAMKNDMHLSGGERISVRGKGRGIVEFGGQSKKGRIFVTIAH